MRLGLHRWRCSAVGYAEAAERLEENVSRLKAVDGSADSDEILVAVEEHLHVGLFLSELHQVLKHHQQWLPRQHQQILAVNVGRLLLRDALRHFQSNALASALSPLVASNLKALLIEYEDHVLHEGAYTLNYKANSTGFYL